MLTHERLLSLLHYDPETGIWTWLSNRGGTARKGSRAGAIDTYGYRQIKVDCVGYLSARLAWFYVKGEWPAVEIDHENRVRADDRWSNLREATRLENMANAVMPVGTVGLFGVTPLKRAGGVIRYVAQYKGHIGVYETPELAHAAAVAARDGRPVE